MALRDNLKRLREQQGMTGKEFAASIGISYTTYMNYENSNPEKARWPSEETLVKIAAALHVSLDDLLGYHALGKIKGIDVSKYFNDLGFWITPSSWEGWVIVSANEPGHEELDNLFSVPRNDLEKIMIATEADAQKFKRSKLLAALKEVQAASYNAFYNKMIDEIKQKDISDVEKKEQIDFLTNLLTKETGHHSEE